MPYTLGQAAKATGKSKPTIQRAIKNGVMSAAKAADGSYSIDPAELHRVFPPVTAQSNDPNPLVTPDHSAELARLQATVNGLERLCRQVEGERDSLREQNVRLTGLLTDQRPQPTPAAAPPVPIASAKPSWAWWWPF